jgi:Protein of unknown function (DUF5674)
MDFVSLRITRVKIALKDTTEHRQDQQTTPVILMQIVYTLLHVKGGTDRVVIHIIRSRVTAQQMTDMLEALDTYVKLAVDVQRGILAGGGPMHADCEAALLKSGSRQEDVWGADWNPRAQQVTFEALINIRPRQNNAALEILDPAIRECVSEIVRRLLGAA